MKPLRYEHRCIRCGGRLQKRKSVQGEHPDSWRYQLCPYCLAKLKGV